MTTCWGSRPAASLALISFIKTCLEQTSIRGEAGGDALRTCSAALRTSGATTREPSYYPGAQRAGGAMVLSA